MSQHMDKICNDLRDRLARLEHRAQVARTNIEVAPRQAADAIHSHFEQLQARVDQKRPGVEQARQRIEQWQAQEPQRLRQSLSEWNSARLYEQIEAKARECEEYAAATAELAIAAVDQAEAAAMEAIVTRQEIERTQKPVPRK